MTELVQILTGTLGTIGFGILYNLRGKKLLLGAIGGLLGWSIFLALQPLVASESIRYLFCAMGITVYAEIFARIEKAPTTVFLAPSVIPLVPGSSLYYTMNYALNSQWEAFAQKALYTLELVFFMAVGIIAITTLTRVLTMIRKKLTKDSDLSHFHAVK